MRVLQLIDTLEAGGAERMAVNIANASMNHKFYGCICATRKGGGLESVIVEGIPTLVANKSSFYDLKALLIILKFIRKHKISIIHAHSTSIYTAFLLKLMKPKLKLIWHDHYGLSEFVYQRSSQKILKIISKFMSGIIACNEDLADWSRNVLYCKKVIFLPNFIIENKEQQLSTNILGQQGKRIVCLANLRPQKNHIELLKIFKQVTIHFPEWTLHLIGKDFNDKTSANIKEYIISNNLSDVAYLYGSREDVSAILREMDIGVLTSTSEGLPLALLEYGQAGLAVMVTNVGQCAQVVQKTGDVITDVVQEGPQVLTRLIKDKEYRLYQANNFKKRVIENYSESSSLHSLLDFYISI